MTGREGSDRLGRAQRLVDEFLTGRPPRTARAYLGDIEDFAQFRSHERAAAVADLIDGGSEASQRAVLDYAVARRHQRRALKTVNRRLYTLRLLVRTARDAGLVDWDLELPSEDEIRAGLRAQPPAHDTSYLFEWHPAEVDRLDLQHFAIRETQGGNYSAPIGTPSWVLDVGTGTGQWGFELCTEFPRARVVGLDVVVGKRDSPENFQWARGNVLDGLPFRDGCFDFTHQRLLVAALPVSRYPAEVAELARVTRPGGWVELVEFGWAFINGGPASRALITLARELSGAFGLDAKGVVFDSVDQWLRDVGLEDVERTELIVPIGVWGGDVGRLMVTDCRTGLTRVVEGLRARAMIEPGRGEELLRKAQEEWMHGRMSAAFATAFGRKPKR